MSFRINIIIKIEELSSIVTTNFFKKEFEEKSIITYLYFINNMQCKSINDDYCTSLDKNDKQEK